MAKISGEFRSQQRSVAGGGGVFLQSGIEFCGQFRERVVAAAAEGQIARRIPGESQAVAEVAFDNFRTAVVFIEFHHNVTAKQSVACQ